jgi:CRP/FNR family cyclic AMP-dependent transcriptional regulator
MHNSSGNQYDLLKSIDLFEGLDEESLEILQQNARALSFRKNTVLMSEGETGESLYIVKSGSIKVYVSDGEGHEIVLEVEGPGSYIGEVSLLDNEPRTASAITLESTEVLAVSKSVFVDCVNRNPDVAIVIIRAMTRRLRRATNTIRSLALDNVYQRLSAKLRELAEASGDTYALSRKFSNQELGDMIGASREMVGKILNDLTAGGYIEQRNRRWHLLRELPANW